VSPFLLLLVVQAQVYSWTDKSGVEHFTDDLKAVPRGVKVRTTEGTEISRIENDVKKPAPTAQVVVASPNEPAAPSIAEETWRRLFREARGKIINLEDEIEADRKKVEEVNGLPVTARFNCQTGFSPYPYPVFGQQMVVNGGSINVGGQLAPGFVVNGSVATTTVTGTGAPVITQTPMYYAPCGFNTNPEFDRIRDRLERNRREVVRAREELADLDRRASYDSVPQEWRR
jgi:hypothetical protein